MRSASIAAAALVLAPRALCAEQQRLTDAVHWPSSASHSAAAPAYRDELLRLHKSLVSIESITDNENEVGSFLVDYLTERGYTADLQFVAPTNGTPDGRERFNVLAWHGGKRPNPRVVVSSHIDVVPPHIPYGIEHGEVTKDTVITGRGSTDAKGSVATMIVALELLLAAKTINGDDVMLLFVVGEEVSGAGMRTFSDSLADMDPPPRFDAVIFGEPTENKLACGHKGGLFCDVTVRGLPGHSGYPWLGKSANELMVRAMARIIDTDLGSSDLFGNTTVNIGLFEGGVAGNVIPEHAFVKLVTRVAIGPEDEGHKIVHRKIQAIFDEIDDEAFTFECSHAYGSVKTNCDVPGKILPRHLADSFGMQVTGLGMLTGSRL